MEFPIEIQHVINEYAKPMTHPNWKTLHKMTLDTFIHQVQNGLYTTHILPVTIKVLYNICITIIFEIEHND